MSNDNKANLKARDEAYNHIQAGKRGLLLSLTTCQLAKAPIDTKSFTRYDNKRYHRDLSKLVSGHASRNLLAFFVPDNRAASQAVTIYSRIAPRAHLSALRGQTIISMANYLPTDYDGLTLQNKIVFGRICGAVSNKTESKTRHPIPLLYSVTLTQNLLGGHHFA